MQRKAERKHRDLAIEKNRKNKISEIMINGSFDYGCAKKWEIKLNDDSKLDEIMINECDFCLKRCIDNNFIRRVYAIKRDSDKFLEYFRHLEDFPPPCSTVFIIVFFDGTRTSIDCQYYHDVVPTLTSEEHTLFGNFACPKCNGDYSNVSYTFDKSKIIEL